MREDERLFQQANDTAMGRGVTQDYVKAAFLCEKAAAMGNLKAEFVILASTYKPFRPGDIHDVNTEEIIPFRYLNYQYLFRPVEDEEEAMRQLRECAEYGIPEAQYVMAVYSEGKERNLWMKKAADQDFLPAMRRMKEKAKNDHNLKEYDDWKIKVFIAENNRDREKYSPDGSITPEYADWLINAPDDGIGREESRKYYRKAAEAGYAEAQVKLAMTYDSHDPHYLGWLLKAGEQNNCNACEDLMDYYAPEESDANYFYWLKKGADLGDPLLEQNLADYYVHEEIAPGKKNPRRDLSAAIEYYKRAAGHEKDNVSAENERNHHEHLNALLRKAMGDETSDLFAVNAGLNLFAIDDLMNGHQKPDQETLRKIARRARNGVTYEELCDAVKADEDTVIHDDGREVHYLQYTREEDLEGYFQKIVHEFNGEDMESSEWFLICILRKLRDLDVWADDAYRSMYSYEFTGKERTVDNRDYQNVVFYLPDENVLYIVKGTISWLATEGEEIHDCRFQMDDIEKHQGKKTRHERIAELRQDLKDYSAEKKCEIPAVQEGYGFYVNDDHLKEAEKYCEEYSFLWPIDLEDPERYQEFNTSAEIDGRWQLVAEIMRSRYGIPFFCYKRDDRYEDVPSAQMIMVEKKNCDIEKNEEDVLKACSETASTLNIPSFGTVWNVEVKSYSLTPEYPVKSTEEDMDQELEQLKMEIEEDPEDLDAVVPYVELLNEKSRSATTSSEAKACLSETKQLDLAVLHDDEVWGLINEMQKRYRSLLKKENLKKLMEELKEQIDQDPDSSSLFEQYMVVVREYVPYCDYEECRKILDYTVEHSDPAPDLDELMKLMDALNEQCVRQDPTGKHSETRQFFQYVKNHYEEEHTMQTSETYALCLYLNTEDNERITKMKEIFHQNPYDLSIAEMYASMMNREVISHNDDDISMDRIEAYAEELSEMSERFYASEKIGMADHNVKEIIRNRKQMERD